MNVTEADTVLEVLSGYWPTPALTEEEAKAWGTELCGRVRITTEEAAKVIHEWLASVPVDIPLASRPDRR